MATFKTFTNRRTGTEIEVGTAEELGVDPEGGKWVTACTPHGNLVNSSTLERAIAAGRYPDFCHECAGALCFG